MLPVCFLQRQPNLVLFYDPEKKMLFYLTRGLEVSLMCWKHKGRVGDRGGLSEPCCLFGFFSLTFHQPDEGNNYSPQTAEPSRREQREALCLLEPAEDLQTCPGPGSQQFTAFIQQQQPPSLAGGGRSRGATSLARG